MADQSENDRKMQTRLWSRLPVILLMTMVLVMAGLLSALTAMRFAIRGREVIVPELAGMTEADASELLFDVGLGMDVESRRFSNAVSEGEILEQTPAAGMSVKRERSVRVLLSLGERRFPVPDVEGNSLRIAQMLLDQRGLLIGNTLYAHSDAGVASTVIYQSPPAGDMGGADPAVNVLVSLGPIDNYFIMPDLSGQLVADVTGRMRSEGFRLGQIRYASQPGTVGGRILGQQPPAGYKVAKNDIIRLEVSE